MVCRCILLVWLWMNEQTRAKIRALSWISSVLEVTYNIHVGTVIMSISDIHLHFGHSPLPTLTTTTSTPRPNQETKSQSPLTSPPHTSTDKTMSTHATELLEQQLFTAIKTQIISLATPLYGTRSEDASKVYDVVTYSMTTNNVGSSNDSRSTFNTASNSSDNDGEERTWPTYGVALILYTGPSSSPFISWTLISHVEDQPDIITGANCLLEDLRRGMGGVISEFMSLLSFLLFYLPAFVFRFYRWGKENEGVVD